MQLSHLQKVLLRLLLLLQHPTGLSDPIFKSCFIHVLFVLTASFHLVSSRDESGSYVNPSCGRNPPGSPAELCQLWVGDVITTLGGAKVEQLSCSQWESTMTSALQSGSLTMDVSRYSNQGKTGHSSGERISIMFMVPPSGINM